MTPLKNADPPYHWQDTSPKKLPPGFTPAQYEHMNSSYKEEAAASSQIGEALTSPRRGQKGPRPGWPA